MTHYGRRLIVPAPLDPEDVAVSTFGIPIEREARLGLYGLLDRRLRVPMVNDAAEIWGRVYMGQLRDTKLMIASGRWNPGAPDPVRLVPGDVPALRGIATQLCLTSGMMLIADYRPPEMPEEGPPCDVVFEQVWPLFQAGFLYEAQNYFLPVTSALGILASQPPPPDMLQELQLPYPTVAVYFGAELEIPAELVVSEADALERHRASKAESRRAAAVYGLGPPADILESIAAHGGRLSGVAMFQEEGGGLADEVVYVLTSEEMMAGEGPQSLDHARGTAMGLRSRSTLDPLIVNLAAAVSWGDWHPPETTLDLPADATSPLFDRAVRSGRFRRQEPRGGFANVRVLDTVRMHARAKLVGESEHRSPVTHLRRGHWRRVRIGPRDNWTYSPRWIAPVVVNPGAEPDPGMRVYRLPLPPEPPPRPSGPDG
jgi:hypothetical protein